jgi:hypothetical protein
MRLQISRDQGLVLRQSGSLSAPMLSPQYVLADHGGWSSEVSGQTPDVVGQGWDAHQFSKKPKTMEQP